MMKCATTARSHFRKQYFAENICQHQNTFCRL